MRKYKVYIPGVTSKNNIVRGFAEAERVAKELYEEYIKGNGSDDYVVCFEANWWDEIDSLDEYLIYGDDYYGEVYWRIMVNGEYCPLYPRLLSKDEEEWLQSLRDEPEIHVCDLNDDELKQLFSQVAIGSLYYSDYENTFEIYEREVCDICDGFLEWISTDEYGKYYENEEDCMECSASNFIDYVRGFCDF